MSIRSIPSANQLNIALICLYFLLATTWLFAPLITGNEYGNLRFISSYEGHGQVWSWLFRASDIGASALFAGLILRFRLWHKDRTMALLLLIVIVLAAIDAIFAIDCKPGITRYCVEQQQLSTTLHDQESTLSVFAIGAAIIWDIWRRLRIGSIVFLIAQIAFAVFASTRPIPRQQLAVLQFAYQVILILWLLYSLEAFVPRYNISANASRWFRQILAYWVGASGIVTIVTAAAHLRLFNPNFMLYFGDHAPWIAPQAVFVGVLMLYLARQIYQGQRRAAYLLLLIIMFETIKYSLIEPDPPLLLVYLVTFIVLFVARHTFRRNIGPITVHRRLVDLAVMLGGVAIALAIIMVILIATGRVHRVALALTSDTGSLTRRYDHRLFLQGIHLRTALGVLGLSISGVGVWSLFRPSDVAHEAGDVTEKSAAARRLLMKYSLSSEDFFKVWPTDKRYFFADDHTGFIAYKYVSGTVFALDSPIASSSTARQKLLKDFYDFCDMNGWKICFLEVTEASRQLYEPTLSILPIGSSAVIDIATFTSKTRRDKWWRWQYNRATKAGLAYHSSQPPHSSELMDEIRTVSDTWLTRSGHREQGFALGYFDATYMQQCIIHYLRDASGTVVAFTNQVPVFRGSQATVDLLRFIPDYDGAMPFLLLSVISVLAETREYTTFDLGFVPLAQIQSRSGQLIKTITKQRFSAAGLEQFKGKFKPDWQPAYIAYSGDIIDLAALAVKLEAAFKPPDSVSKN